MKSQKRTAFTLVELLVVIGIIAVLVGILLPALNRAREQANGARCAANMRSATQALMYYTTQYRGWLPGPHTSGQHLLSSSGKMTTNDSSVDTAPVQNMDWMSPTLGLVGKYPENEFERLKAFYRSQLSCPSNQATFNAFYDGASKSPPETDLPYQSYAAVIHFHAWPKSGTLDDVRTPHIWNATSGPILLTQNYFPMITKVGAPAKKVYLVEGARYINAVGDLSFNNLRYQVVGGNFMVVPPWGPTATGDTPFQIPSGKAAFSPRLNGVNSTYGWRHKGKMNLAFFDGHVEMRAIGDTISWGLYFPRGSKLNGAANETYDPYDKLNQVTD